MGKIRFGLLLLTALQCAGPSLRSRHSDGPLRKFELLPQSPEFWKLFDRNAALRTVATGFGFTEGPLWDPKGFLYVSDETQNKVYRVHLDGHRDALVSLGDPDGNTFDRRLRLIDCASVLRAVILVHSDGTCKILADHFQGQRFNSPNDVVSGPDGALYFTDPTLDLPAGQKQEIPFQGVYRLDHRGNLKLLIRDMSQPNGLAFSPDGKTLYVDDSAQKKIRAFDFSRAADVSNERMFGEETGSEGVPDGMKVDDTGNLFVVGPKGIWVWDSRGHHLGTVVLPEQPANLAWGDEDYETLYITATTSLYRLRTRAHGFLPYLSAKSSSARRN